LKFKWGEPLNLALVEKKFFGPIPEARSSGRESAHSSPAG